MDLNQYIQAHGQEHATVLEKTLKTLGGELVQAVDLAAKALQNGKKLMFFGNGGSAADAQHIAAEFVGRLKTDRPALAALALTTDTSVLTAVGNDYSYDQIFSRQIEALGTSGDVAIGLSTSGQSPNVIKGLQAARSKGLKTLTFVGSRGESLRPICDVAVVVPSDNTMRIQEMHIFLLHVFCSLVEKQMGLVK